MNRLSAGLLLALVFALLQIPETFSPALACSSTSSTSSSASGHDNLITTGIAESTSQICSRQPAATTALPVSGHWESSAECDVQIDSRCTPNRICSDGSVAVSWWYQMPDGSQLYPTDVCPTDPNPASRGPSQGAIIQAFRSLPLPASRLTIQPPGGETLVNFATIFYTTNNRPFTRAVRLLGHQVEFRITPSQYLWKFDDGHWTTTHDPGKPFTTAAAIGNDLTHKYLTADTFYPSVDTTYTANYRVDGGPWAPVSGTVSIEGAPVRLITRTATPVLVDDPPTG